MSFVKSIADKVYPHIEPYIVKAGSLSVHPADLFFAQYKDGVYSRYDMIVRYLFAENYFGKNDCGEKLYRKMQSARIGENQQPVDRFNSLIASYEEKGYDPSSYILVKQNLSIRNGSHRGALALYYNKPLTCYFEKDNSFVDYPLNWFGENGFDSEEISIITDKVETLKQHYNKPLNIVVFGDNTHKTDEICNAMAEFGAVTDCRQYTLSQAQCSELYQNIAMVCDLYGNSKVGKFNVENPSIVVVKLQLHQPQITTADNNKHNSLKRFFTYRLPVIRQSGLIRKAITEKTSVKDNMLFVPHNFYQNSESEALFSCLESK